MNRFPDANTATAAAFERAAHRNANAFWLWAVLAGLCTWLFGWFAILPALAAIWCALSSISATRCAGQLRAGTYGLPNLNNGAPDVDVARPSSFQPTPAGKRLFDYGCKMNWEEAEALVQKFATIVSVGAPLIGDAATLPATKTQMNEAFQTRLLVLKAELQVFENQTWGLNMATDRAKQIRLVESLYIRLADYQDIEPIDRALVARINALAKDDPWPDWALPLIGKYITPRP